VTGANKGLSKAGRIEARDQIDMTVDNREQDGLTTAIRIAISAPPGTSGLLALDGNRK
jgi:hypothetical protein